MSEFRAKSDYPILSCSPGARVQARLRAVLTCCLIFAITATPCLGQLITFAFTGVVDESFSELVDKHDPIEGTFTYSLDGPDNDMRPNVGHYKFTRLFGPQWPVGIFYTVGSNTITGGRGLVTSWTVVDGGFPLLGGCSNPCDGFTFSDSSSLLQSYGVIRLVDPSGTAFDSDEAPTDLDLNDFATREFEGWVGGHSFEGHLTSLELVGIHQLVPGDRNGDDDVDSQDVQQFFNCSTGPNVGPVFPWCAWADFDQDVDIDHDDFGVMQRCISGEDQPGDLTCADLP